MSANTNTLFKPLTIGIEKSTATAVKSSEPTNSFSTSTTTNIPTVTASSTITTTSTTTTLAPSISTATAATATTTPIAPQNNTNKENTRYIPPVFFIGAVEHKTKLQVGPDQEIFRSGSLSLGHGERRLSTVFPEDGVNEPKDQDTVLKILIKPETSNRGLFGDGSVEKIEISTPDPSSVLAQEIGNSSNSIGSEIEITGYKLGTEKTVKDHLLQYGTVVRYETVDGKLVVQFEESGSATSALKSDGFVLEGEKILVKLHGAATTELNDAKDGELQKILPTKMLKMPSDLYKNTKPVTNKLGSGQYGMTALDKNASIRTTDKPKEVSLYNRFLEFVLGW